METETKTITQLPIMKYFDDAKLVEKGKESEEDCVVICLNSCE